MNNKILALGAGLLIAGSAMAAPTVKDFPTVPPVVESDPFAAMPGMQRAPLNQTANLGTYMFGYTMYDNLLVDHFSGLWTNDLTNPIKMQAISDPSVEFHQDYFKLLMMLGGGWAGGDEYYAYRYRNYDVVGPLLESFVKVNIATGEHEILEEYYESRKSLKAFPENIFVNPQDTDIVYALARSTNGTTTSAIWQMDPASGELVENLAELPEYYFCAAFDYDNQVYAIRWDYDKDDDSGAITGTVLDLLDPDDNFSVISSTPVLVDGKPYKISYITNYISFDYTTGDLWWSATDSDGKSAMIQVDPLAKTGHRIGSLVSPEWFGGIYIPFQTADKRTAPARVEDMSFTIDPNGDNKVTISWTNPTTQWNRRNLNSLAEVLVYRDKYEGTPVATLDATGKVGAKMSWTDETATNGVHTYYVVACAKQGEKGVPRSIDAFVGKDVPGAVSDLKAETTDGKSVVISWGLPAKGDSDGWYDNSDLTYTVTRMPGNTLVGTTKDLTITDNTIGDATLYTYEVYATNAQGKGTVATSNQVFAGNSVLVPFKADFDDQLAANRFTALDLNGDGRTYGWDWSTNKAGTHCMRLDYPEVGGNNDMLVSPPIILEKDKIYKVTFFVSLGGTGSYDRSYELPIKIMGGTDATAEAMSTVIADMPDHVAQGIYTQDDITVYYKATADGDYHFGYLNQAQDNSWQYIEGFSIEEAPSNDLEAISVACHLHLSTIEDNDFTVTVYNNGDVAQSEYTVKLATLDDKGEPEVFAQTSLVPELEPYTSDIVEFKGKPAEVGTKQLVAIVELANDGNHNNDTTAPMAVVCEEAPAFTHSAKNDLAPYTSTNVPLNHFYNYTASQTIYAPSETGFNRYFAGDQPIITRLAWEYEGKADFDGTHVEIYVDQTNRQSFVYDAEDWIPVYSMPVFEGEWRFQQGHHYLVADLDEENYVQFDPSFPLLVTMNKAEQGHADFLASFYTSDGDWGAEHYRTKLIQNTSKIDVISPAGKINAHPDAPVLHLAIISTSGIENVAITSQGAVLYNAATRTVSAVDMELTSVEVYNLAGAMVERVAANGNEAQINVANGIYLLKANTAEGKSVTIKANVR